MILAVDEATQTAKQLFFLFGGGIFQCPLGHVLRVDVNRKRAGRSRCKPGTG